MRCGTGCETWQDLQYANADSSTVCEQLQLVVSIQSARDLSHNELELKET